MAVGVVDLLKMVQIHHQYTKRSRLFFGATGFAAQFGKERFAGKQTGQLVMNEEAMDLLLELAVDLIQQFETKQVIAYANFVAFIQKSFGNKVSVYVSSIRRGEVGNLEASKAGGKAAYCGDLSMQA